MKLTCALGAMLAGMLVLPTCYAAQTSTSAAGSTLPEGTLLPVSIGHGLNAHKLRAGQTVRLRLMQSVPQTSVHRGAKVVGRVVSVSTPGTPARLAIRFDAVESHGQRIPIRTDLRAIASPTEVQQAQMPEDMSSRGLNPETWTTQQIGGDQVYRGGGPVAQGVTEVGKPVAYGVEGQPRIELGKPCRGLVADNTRPQALWLFSVNACGVYGFPNLTVEHAGRSTGTIELASTNGQLHLGGGTALLLRVDGQ